MALTYDSRGNPVLQYGVQDGSVAWLNERLAWWGYTAGTGDVFDWTTAEAVAKFQRDYGMATPEREGVMDEATWVLFEELATGARRPWHEVNATPDMGPLPGSPYSRGPDTAGPTPTPSAMTGPQRNAMARLQQVLATYGMGSMADFLREKILADASDAEILLDLQQTPEFKARFPVIEARQKAGLTPVSVGEVLAYETSSREILRRAGLTSPEYTDSTYLQGLMGRDLSPAELQDRLNDGLLRVTQAPPEVRAAFSQWFGVDGDTAMAKLFLDPDKATPELEKMAMTSYVGGIGNRFNVDVAMGVAREIADTGLSQAAVWQGFQDLNEMDALFMETISESTDLQANVEGAAAVFGTQPGAKATLDQRRLGRVNQFKGGGGAATTNEGAIGLGVADS